ncbi:MAG: T9SS type A sorting domain-containing protein, partial [Bacteroidales bacterium]|nr:T9SS type A sorting domain-containing protein [Bacteroidales bacterium]
KINIMKKITILFFTLLLTAGLFAQKQGIVTRIKTNNTLGEKTDPAVEITLGEITQTTVDVSFTPNAVCSSYYIYISPDATPNIGMIKFFGLLKTGDYTHLWSALDGATEYTIFVLPRNSEDEEFAINSLTFTTSAGGGTAIAEIDIQVSEITDKSVKLIATPNDQTAVYFDGLITVDYYNEIGEDSVINYFTTSTQPLYTQDNWVWPGLKHGTAYYAIAIGKNANSEWGPLALEIFTTEMAGGNGISEIEVQISNITHNSINIIATPNAETAVFHVGLITVDEYNEMGEDSVNNLLENDGYYQYEAINWDWEELLPETSYYALAVGYNANFEWGTTNSVEFTTLSTVGILNSEVKKSTISLFPNPSNGTFNFLSTHENRGKIAIYSITGQKVYEQTISNTVSRINANQLSNGLYQVVFTSENSAKTEVQQLIVSK